MKHLIAIWATAWVLSSCAAQMPEIDARHARLDVSPEIIPVQFSLSPTQRVLVLEFEATDAGYRVVQRSRFGNPSQGYDLNRDVLITGLDANGRLIAATSVYNPRAVSTTGASDPKTAILGKGTFVVAFDNPEAIRSISIEVRRGPNAGFKEVIPIELIEK